MSTLTARPAIDVTRQAGGVVVAVVGAVTRGTASLLSCRMHEAIGRADRGSTVTVDLGVGTVADAALERVLLCARESALAGGVDFRVR